MQKNHYHYGLTGHSPGGYDTFLGLGNKAKARKKARRSRQAERKQIRTDRMRIKNEGKAAEAEATKAQTMAMRSALETNPSASQLYWQKNHAPAGLPPPDLDDPDQVPEYGRDNTMTYVLIGIGVVAVAVAAITLSKKGGKTGYKMSRANNPIAA